VTVTTGEPPTTIHTIEGRDGQRFNFNGRRLGSGTSWRDGKPRWFEVDIYLAGETYIIHTQGRSEVAGETTLSRILRTKSPFEVVEMLTVKKCNTCGQHSCQDRNHSDRRLYLPRQSAHALAQAAQWDDGIRDAYVNRAVV